MSVFYKESNITLPILDVSNVRWVSCTLPNEKSIKAGIKIREHLVLSAIRLRNIKGAIPTQKRLAERIGIKEQNIKAPIDRLRSVDLLDKKKLQAQDSNGFHRTKRNGTPLTIRVPCPGENCPLNLEALIVWAAYQAFPKDQSILSLSRLTGLKWDTVKKSIANILKAGDSDDSWFVVKKFNSVNVEHPFTKWCKKANPPRHLRSGYSRAWDFLGIKKFIELYNQAIEKCIDGNWCRLFNYLIEKERTRLIEARQQLQAVTLNAEFHHEPPAKVSAPIAKPIQETEPPKKSMAEVIEGLKNL